MRQILKDAMGTQVPLEVYLRSSEYEPDAEYVDGQVEERSGGEFDHAAWQRTIKLEAYAAMRTGQIWLINPEGGVISQYREHTFVPGDRFCVESNHIDFSMAAIRALLPKKQTHG